MMARVIELLNLKITYPNAILTLTDESNLFIKLTWTHHHTLRR